MKMIGKRYLIERYPEQEQTKGGIIIPETYRERAMGGKVILNNPETALVAVDSEILFAKYAGLAVCIGEKDYLVMSEDDILMVL
jgi:chaperonin GroES